MRRLGLLPYADALDLQRSLVEERKADRIPDTLLLLEHPHVLTLGVRTGARANILVSDTLLAERGIPVVETGRGGDITYHGPGQLVGYPIIDLRPDRQDVHRYVRDLEEVMLRTCAQYGLPATRLAGLSGAWLNDEHRGSQKVAAIGVRVARWVTSHGFALNVNTDLSLFDLIVPCGISDHGVTSFAARLGREVELGEVESVVAAQFAAVFGREPSNSEPSNP